MAVHWDFVGSTPVGLWAHTCNKIIDPSGAFWINGVNMSIRELGGYREIVHHAIKVQSIGGWIPISILAHFNTGIRKNTRMVGPRWIWQVNFRALLESRQQCSAITNSASARDGLNGAELKVDKWIIIPNFPRQNLFVGNNVASSTQNESWGRFGEGCKSFNWQILMIQHQIIDNINFCLNKNAIRDGEMVDDFFHSRQNPRFAIVVSVCSHA